MVADGPALLVASTGGHLAQLHRLHTRLEGVDAERAHWATFDTPQSRSLLDGRPVHHVAFTESRDYCNVAGNLVAARRILKQVRPSVLVSTGSGIALSFFPVARMMGIPLAYIESAARSEGPSVTGQTVARIPGVRTYSQYRVWADERWTYAGSVFDEYEAGPERGPHAGPLKVVVSLGTIRYPFRRLVDRLRAVLPADAEVLWQTGYTDVEGLDLPGEAFVAAADLKQAVRDADVVISHSGVGSALDALEAGKHPVLVHREKAYGEHIDDHQRLVSAELGARGLVSSSSVDELALESIATAASRTSRRALDVPPLDVGVTDVHRTAEDRAQRIAPPSSGTFSSSLASR